MTEKSIFGDVLGNSIARNNRQWVEPAKPVVPEPNRSEKPRNWRDLFDNEVVPVAPVGNSGPTGDEGGYIDLARRGEPYGGDPDGRVQGRGVAFRGNMHGKGTASAADNEPVNNIQMFTNKARRPAETVDEFNARVYEARLNGTLGSTKPSVGGEVASVGLDLLPVVGPGKSILQVFTGKDLVTGEPVNRWVESAGIALGMVPGGKVLLKGGKVADIASSVAKHADGGTSTAVEAGGILFGQKRVGPTFGVEGRPSYLAGREISAVATDLRLGRIHPDQLPIDAFKYNGQLVSANTRSLSALSEAGLQPTNVNIIQPSRALLRRLQETPLLPNAPLPGPRVPVTPNQSDLTILRVIETPGGR
ncbi:pre-toxin TG domain-containing protein [Chitinimonas sp. PSY-7]|uniref:pre-toxin TG domain-containing protein n=1 Tax=Chitinimonas sp. PSY-7 TaxID=3459088 RepID=UPI0040402E82